MDLIATFEMLVERLTNIEIHLENVQRNILNTLSDHSKVCVIVNNKNYYVQASLADNVNLPYPPLWRGLKISFCDDDDKWIFKRPPSFIKSAVLHESQLDHETTQFIIFCKDLFKDNYDDVMNLLDRQWNITQTFEKSESSNPYIQTILPNEPSRKHLVCFLISKYAAHLNLVDDLQDFDSIGSLYYDNAFDMYSIITTKVIPFLDLCGIDVEYLEFQRYKSEKERLLGEI
jgi:hypothetical protein